MFKLIKLAWKFAPHVLIAISCIGFISGLSAIFGKQPPSSPVAMPVRQIRETAQDQLPAWIKVEEGYLDWKQVTTLFRENKKSGEEVEYESVIVPLVGKEGFQPESTSGTLLLVSLKWEYLLLKFPEVAAAIRSKSGLAQTLSPYAVTFEPINAATEFAFGRSNTVCKDFEAMGFANITAVRPGSKPLNRIEGAGITVMTLLMAGAGFLWLRKRRQTAKREAIANAALSGIRQGLREAIEEAVSETVIHTVGDISAGRATNK